MNTESQDPGTRPEPEAASRGTSDTTLAERNAEERADIDEDRRRVRELDDGELGGEA
ncbi:hypothetical protein [Geodermatophilus sp. URMC 60]